CPQAEQPQSLEQSLPVTADDLSRDPDRGRLVRPVGNVRNGPQPDRRDLGRPWQVVGDLPSEELAIGQSHDRARQRFGRQPPEPHWHIGSRRHLREGSPFDREIKPPRWIEPGPWYGERE